MNPVVMTIVNCRKELWSSRESNQRSPVLKSLYATDWAMALGSLIQMPSVGPFSNNTDISNVSNILHHNGDDDANDENAVTTKCISCRILRKQPS